MTLTKTEIIKRLHPKQEPGFESLIITPLLDKEDQIGISSIDVRLGKQFIIFKEHITEIFSPTDKNDAQEEISKYQEEVVVPIKGSLTLHPGKLIIGSTFEYICIPSDLECQVEGRSSWARLGLVVATATTVEPGYKGVVTLELSNSGTIPIKLFPGVKIAQLILHKTTGDFKQEDNTKKYSYAIGPGFSKVHKDKYLSYFCK